VRSLQLRALGSGQPEFLSPELVCQGQFRHWILRLPGAALAQVERSGGLLGVARSDLAHAVSADSLAIHGDAVWVPGPSPWPWGIGAVLMAGVVVLLCRTRIWRAAMVGALGVLIASEVVHVVGAWTGSTTPLGSRAFASIYSVGAIAVAVLALVWLLRRDPWAATPVVLIAGLFVLVAGGMADLTTLTRSQLPTGLPGTLARMTVGLALGVGSGLVIAAATRLRAPSIRPARHGPRAAG